MATLQELYAAKGELLTTIEIAQARLKQVNQALSDEFNKPKQVEEKKEG